MTPGVWIWLSPLTGALIGTVTNYLAIRMLFRPLRPVRIFGIRLPMTPGVIPARRGELAANIGRTVGERLLTRDTLLRQIETEAFQTGLRKMVSETLRELLDRPPREGIDAFDETSREALRRFRHELAARTSRWLLEELRTGNLGAFLKEEAENLMARAPRDLLGAADTESYLSSLLRLLGESSAVARTGEILDALLADTLRVWKDDGQNLGDLLPESFFETAGETLEARLPKMLAGLGGRLDEEGFRAPLRIFLRETLLQLMRRLGVLAGLFSITLNTKDLDGKIDAFLLNRRGDLEGLFQREAARALFRPLTHTVVAGLRDLTPEELLRGLAGSDDGAAFSRFTLFRLIEPKAFQNAVRQGADRFLRSLLERPFSEWTRPESGSPPLLERIFQSAETDRFVHERIHELFEQAASAAATTPPAAYVPEGLFFRLEEEITRGILRIFEKEVPELIDRLELRTIVEEKVNGLDLIEVEALIEGILNRELKAITLFGAVLGAVVGLLNVFVFLL